MSHKQLLMTAQESVVAGLANENIPVVYDAVCPHADLENRVMHLRPVPDHLEPVDLEDLRGDCDHELGHFLYSDVEALKLVDCPLEKILLNAIEDGRIEALVAERWIGCAENLEASGMRAVQEILLKADQSDEWRQRRCLIALQFLAYGDSWDHVLWAAGQDVEPLLDELGDDLDGIESLETTMHALVMARKIAKKWKKWAKKKPKPPKRGKSKSKKKGQKGSVEQRTEAFSKFNPEDEGQEGAESEEAGQGDGGEGKDGEGKGDEKSDKSLEKDSEGSVEDAPSQTEITLLAQSMEHGSITKQRKKFIQENTFKSSDRYLADTSEDTVETVGKTKWGDKIAKKFDDALEKHVPVLRRKLYMEFYAEVRCERRHQRRGKIDQRALHKVGVGSSYLFKQKMPTQEVHAEVTLLVDWSASMTGKSQFVAAQCAAAMSQVCDLLKIPNEILAFTTGMRDEIQERSLFDRLTPLRHFIVKPRHARYQEVTDAIHSLAYDDTACDHNIDGEGLLWAAQRLARNLGPGRKPILIVFSDGRPNGKYSDSTSTLQRHLRNTIKRIESAGVALLGVGIETDYVERFYTNWVTVDSLDDLGEDFFEEFRKVLRKYSIKRR